MGDTHSGHMMRWVIVGGLIGLVVIGILGTLVAQGAWNRLSTRPIDMTQMQQRIGIQAPSPVAAFFKRDGVAFRAHAGLAMLIAGANGDPSAAGVQWVKAAAHARTDADLDRVSRGLVWAREHTDSVTTLQSTLCSYVENGYWTGVQQQAFEAAGFQCPSFRRSRAVR